MKLNQSQEEWPASETEITLHPDLHDWLAPDVQTSPRWGIVQIATIRLTWSP